MAANNKAVKYGHRKMIKFSKAGLAELKKQAKAAGFASSSKYIRELLDRDHANIVKLSESVGTGLNLSKLTPKFSYNAGLEDEDESAPDGAELASPGDTPADGGPAGNGESGATKTAKRGKAPRRRAAKPKASPKAKSGAKGPAKSRKLSRMMDRAAAKAKPRTTRAKGEKKTPKPAKKKPAAKARAPRASKPKVSKAPKAAKSRKPADRPASKPRARKAAKPEKSAELTTADLVRSMTENAD